MGFVTGFARAVTTLNRWLARGLSLAVLALFALLLSDVVLRYAVQAPMVWSAELATLIFGVYAILGGGYLLARRQHVNVDLIYAGMPRRARALTDVITSALFFLFVLVLLVESWGMAADSISRWERSFLSTWRPYVWPFKALIPVAAILLLLQGVVKLIADLMILAGVEPDPEAFGPITEPDDASGEREAI